MAWPKSNSDRAIDRAPDIRPLGFARPAAIILALFAGHVSGPPADAEGPFGLQARVPWTSSKLAGSPEPPLPYTVEKVFTKLTWKNPIYLAEEPGTDRLWVIQAGDQADDGSRIVRLADDPDAAESMVVLDMPKWQIYAACFHPDYATNGHVYLFSNGPRGIETRRNKIARYTVEREPPRRIAPASEEVVIEWRSAGHDGGDLAFGTDGMLYITTGDGTSDSDGWDSGQTLDDLLGSVLRIDVGHRDGGRRYAVPKDNPFVDRPVPAPRSGPTASAIPADAADKKTGQVWVGNNGQDLWETAHLIGRGENYGWSVFEGSHPFYLERKRGPTPIIAPTIEHPHAEFRSLTGGVVYHGDRLPDLEGAYIYGDYSSGRIWGMKHDGRRVVWHRELADTSLQIAAFRVDHRGDLLVVDHGGGLYRLVPRPARDVAEPFPTRLSRTGLFSSTAEHKPAPGVIPYSVNAPGWNDGAGAERFMAVPGSVKVGFSPTSGWTFPDGTALVQTLTLGRDGARFRVETRVLLRQQGEWAGYTFRWDDEQADAILVGKDGEDALLSRVPEADGSGRRWRFPGRAECMACHSRAGNFTLGVSGLQLNRDHDYDGVVDNQFRAMGHIGLLNTAPPEPSKDAERLADPSDAGQAVEKRVRSYLHVNCSPCHVESGGGNSKLELGFSTPREKMNLIGSRPQHDTFGVDNAMLVAPGDPGRSILLHRLSRRRGQMPPLVSSRVDEGAVVLMREWIAGLKPDRSFVRAWSMEDLLPSVERLEAGRSIEPGRKAFREVGCLQCHRIEGEGGSVGPDLAGVSRRLDRQQILESILQPSRVVADDYAEYLIETADGTVLSGRIEREDDRVVVLRPPLAGPAVTVEKSNILQRRRSEKSNMPAGIVNVLDKEQVLDLLVYLIHAPEPAKKEVR